MAKPFYSFALHGIAFNDPANRRMRARMYGGVRGGTGNPSRLLDCVWGVARSPKVPVVPAIFMVFLVLVLVLVPRRRSRSW